MSFIQYILLGYVY